ncbi:hypothetical protein [Streptomyces sp. NPDC059708]|uniref:hypothetical protein n=1 Tax=Streptomyces sp. NPDC059708 TaxID=3346916 RepID=UPI00368D48BA
MVLSPAGDFDHDRAPGDSDGYAYAPADADSRITPAGFAEAVLDEATAPTLHAVHAGVTEAAAV